MEKKILIVDDEKAICENLKEFFDCMGFDAAVATGGKEAVSILQDTFFPVILLDIKMPDLDGIEVLKFTVKRHPEAKVIMVTGFSDEYGKEECLSIGAHDYIGKPIKLVDLRETVNKLFID